MSEIKIPGVVWQLVYVLLVALPVYLAQYWPNAIWVAAVCGAMGVLLKLWEVLRPQGTPLPEMPQASSLPVESSGPGGLLSESVVSLEYVPESRLQRFMLG